jgi:hypothetical protein
MSYSRGANFFDYLSKVNTMANHSSIFQMLFPERLSATFAKDLDQTLVGMNRAFSNGKNCCKPASSLAAIARIRTALLVFAVWMVPGLGSAQTIVVPGAIPKVLVDVKHCQWTSTLCSGSGSVGAAANGNASIAAIYYHGTTAGLTATNFSISSVTNPGGVTPQFVSAATCAACFSEVQPGVYRLAARPSFGNWAGGTYVVIMTVTRPAGGSTSVLVPLDIPF